MRFYDRNSELEELRRISKLSFEDHSRMTVVTGRRRIGKTSLILKATTGEIPAVYLFVGRKNEALLCTEYQSIISEQLAIFVPSEITSFRSLFQYLLEVAETKPFHLIIDEFQEFYNVNPALFSDMQYLWDLYRKRSKMNLIISGSVYSLMQKIFHDKEEPLFGRADNVIKLSAFDTPTLKEIMAGHRTNYSNDDLLALFTFSGGIPKYVELLCDNTDLSIEGMIAYMVRENSPFIEEGKYLLIEEFGKDYGTYFSILSAISGGINTQPQIEASLGNKNVGGHLKRLIEVYQVIERKRPILSKVGTQTVRYDIQDNFLKFWFNYFDRHCPLIEINNFPVLQQIVLQDYPTYSEMVLEKYFAKQLAESHQYRAIGSWWDAKDAQNEIDIVALKLEKRKALVAEVKRQRKNFKPELLEKKVAHLINKVLPKYDVETTCLTLEDM